MYIHAYYNHRYTEVSPSKLKLKKNATRSPWLLFNLCFCLICFPYIYDNILAIFPGGPDLHFPCMLSLTSKHYCSCVQRRERKIVTHSSHQQAHKGLCDNPLLLPAAVTRLRIVTLPETGKATRRRHISFSRWAAGWTQMCSLVSTCATSEILIDATLLKILHFHHWSLTQTYYSIIILYSFFCHQKYTSDFAHEFALQTICVEKKKVKLHKKLLWKQPAQETKTFMTSE